VLWRVREEYMMSLCRAEHVLHVARQHAARAEQVDLEDERVEVVVLVEQVLQRRVRDDAAVPEIVGADLDHRQRGGSAPLAMTCSGLDLLLALSK
jgi:hypothetical protein